MTSLISLRIWLGFSLIMAYESPPPQQPQQTFRIFADLKHTGILDGPSDIVVAGAQTNSASRRRFRLETSVAIDGPKSLTRDDQGGRAAGATASRDNAGCGRRRRFHRKR